MFIFDAAVFFQTTTGLTGSFYGGTSGLKIAVPKRDFPPEHHDKSRLAFYARHENSIEINSSFYNLPQLKTVQRWSGEVPSDFRFSFKFWKKITHQRHLIFNQQDIERFKAVVHLPQQQRGCLLVQFPPSLEVSAKVQLQELLQRVGSNWPVAVEFRHPSWYRDDVYELLFNNGAAMVLQDFPKTATPIELTSDEFVYLRFHGPSGNYKGSYGEGFLYEYAMYINEWRQEGRTVYCYFNNTAGGALHNLYFLKSCLD